MTSSDSFSMTYLGYIDTTCSGTTLLTDGFKETPNFVTVLEPDFPSTSRFTSVRPDKASKSKGALEALSSKSVMCTLWHLARISKNYAG